MHIFKQHSCSTRNVFAGLAKACTLASLLVFLCGPLPLHAEWTLLDGARVHPDYHGPVPKKSDVIFSTRFKRPEALDVLRAFGATRVEWVYSTDKLFIESIKGATGWFGGAVNSFVDLHSEDGLARDYDGQPITPPWMKSWGAKLISLPHPTAEKVLKETVKRYVDLGAGSIQFDDPLLEVQAGYRGGDFSESALDSFRKFLTQYSDKAELNRLGISDIESFDYRQFLSKRFEIKNAEDYVSRYQSLPTTPLWMMFLKDVVRSYFTELRAMLNDASGKRLLLSMNLSISAPTEAKPDFFLSEFADYAMAETPILDFDELNVRAATYRALGIGYVPSILPKSLVENRRAIATLYALGAQPLVPWDVFVLNGPDGRPSRYFGSAQDYSDLYKFVRRDVELFDGLEQAAVVGIIVPIDKYRHQETAALTHRLIRNNVPFMFVLTGGTDRKFTIDSSRIASLRLLVTVNKDVDFSSEDLGAMGSVSVVRVAASELTDKAVEALSPFVTDSRDDQLQLYPRVSTEKANGKSLFVHVVDGAGEEPGRSSVCEKKVGIKVNAVSGRSIRGVTWHSKDRTTEASWSKRASDYLIKIPECTLWGVLHVQF